MNCIRNVSRAEWLYAWHYARYGRRHNSIQAHVGPALRKVARAVETQGRDILAVRAGMAETCSPRTAFIYTTTAL